MDSANSHIDAPKRAMLIINPISGTGNKKGLEEAVREFMGPLGYELDVRITESAGHATQLAREATDKSYDAVLAAGGDGTINETATALCDTGVALGIIPSGSGNGLARHLNIPVNVKASLEVIGRNIISDIDYGTVNNNRFFCTFGVGFDAAVSHSFAKQSRRGMLSYVKCAFTEYVNYKSQTYTISANGKILTEKAFVIACCNASQYGNNAYIAPNASIRDGLLDIIIIHSGSPIDTAMVGMDLFTGYINKNTLIQSLRAPSAVIYRNEEGPAHIDGEPTILSDILDIKCHHNGLKVFIPDDKLPFKPVVTPLRSLWHNIRKRK